MKAGKITDASIQNLKTSLQCYLEKIGFPPKQGRCRCPIHAGDSTKTAMIDTRAGLIGGMPSILHCPKCGKEWDVISLHADLHGLDAKRDFIRICEEAADVVCLSLEYEAADAVRYNRRQSLSVEAWTKAAPATKPSDVPMTSAASAEQKEAEHAALVKVAEQYVNECVLHLEAPDAVQYLENRCISLETAKRFKLGFDPKTQRIVIPSGEGYVARSIAKDCQKKDRHRKAAGLTPRGIAWDTLESGRICWVVEGEFDALSLIEVGHIAAGLGGTEAIKSFCKYLESRHDFETNPPRLLLALDDDDPGNKARDELKSWLMQKGLSFAIATPWHEIACNDDKDENDKYVIKDANDALRQLTSEQFRKSADDEVEGFRDQKQIEAERYMQGNLAARLSSFWKSAQEANSAIKTGFNEIDSILGGGLRPGLYVFGAIPSLGKTALVLQMANTIASAGIDVLYFSLEMPASDLAFRSISRISYEADSKSALTQRELQFTPWDRFSAKPDEAVRKQNVALSAFDQYANGAAQNIWIHDAIGAITVEQIEATIANHKAIRGCAPVVVIDYLQILQSVDPRMTDKAALDYNALRLKQISNTYSVPMLIVSSFNRASYASEAGFESFKESGAVEYCADCLFGLQFKAAIDAKIENASASAEKKADAIRQAIKEAKAKEIREIEFVVLKNRMGRLTGDRGIFLAFNPKFNHFESMHSKF